MCSVDDLEGEFDEICECWDEQDELLHYGIKFRSGRYPYGSGDNPYQHDHTFLARVRELRNQDFTMIDEMTGQLLTGDTAIARSMGMSTGVFRDRYSNAINQEKRDNEARARELLAQGYNRSEVARMMGYTSESSVRALLNERTIARRDASKATAEELKRQLEDLNGEYLNVGDNTELYLGVSKQRMSQALQMLYDEGYEVRVGSVNQQTNMGQKTNIKILCPPGAPNNAAYQYDKIHSLEGVVSYDGGETFKKAFEFPESLDSKRLQIKYAEEGGEDKDGVIELRRGVADLSLGSENYAQVRIMVDGTHYLKGMAVYTDDLPPGVDVRFNTNKHVGTPQEKVLKEVKKDADGNVDKDNPFGSLLKDQEHGGQYYYVGKDGKEHLGLINKTRAEGDWEQWTDSLPSQFLGKQSIPLIERQLGISITDNRRELDEIKSLTNPTVKRQLLETFAEERDYDAAHLQAAALPRQKYHVILPCDGLGENEVYAPQYKSGERLALVRFPHAGRFEIPIVKVTNNNEYGDRVIGKTSIDAIGITKKIADQLSGADFDGDTVMAIPLGRGVNIISEKPLQGLAGFDPKAAYPYREGMKVMSEKYKQKQMGIVSNLITDMTLQGAKPDELSAVTRHSMVVIDAVKHKLDYQSSAKDNNIAYYHEKYQGKKTGGASTLLSRAKSPVDIDKRVGSPKIDPKTGDLEWKQVHEEYVGKDGKTHVRTQTVNRMDLAKDARELSSGTAVENLYAGYANSMKSLAREARLEVLATPRLQQDAKAKVTYAAEVDSLNRKLTDSMKNKPRETQAQLIAAARTKEWKEKNPEQAESKEAVKKYRTTALNNARREVGASRVEITVTDREWEAIQKGAISDSKLRAMLPRMDKDDLRSRATPKTQTGVSQAQINAMARYKAAGMPISQIADRLGVSPSTVSKYLK